MYLTRLLRFMLERFGSPGRFALQLFGGGISVGAHGAGSKRPAVEGLSEISGLCHGEFT